MNVVVVAACSDTRTRASPWRSVYAHLFDRADHAATARGALETSYAATASDR
jgi:hypothetical protein